ncbi:MAG TPA: type II toxin-antitoxin system VapC family toxin [Stellaceae bacterium]|nr:type II toxin-antitoxin system VapC family toxin [Stellaceae bacterium]
MLLDTHALLWWLTDNPRLSYTAEAAITNPANDVFVSACVGYEIAYKQRLGRLPALPESLSRRLRREAIEILPISLDHALAAAALPGPHRDPWDRIMMAQALAEQCHVVTIDKVFSDYRIPVVW